MRPRSARSRAIVTAIAALAATFAVVATASAATLTGVAFKDLDRDGAWQTSEPLLANQEIHLYSPADGPNIALTTTDPFGRYTFAGLADGDSRVAYDTRRGGGCATTGCRRRPGRSSRRVPSP